MYDIIEYGKKYTSDYRVFINKNLRILSPFHHISTFEHDGYLNVVNLSTRNEIVKSEVAKKEPYTPIKHFEVHGKPWLITNVFPCKGYPWNYGFLPQTFEDHYDNLTGMEGNENPLSVIGLGDTKKTGEVYQAKILGCLGVIDTGRCYWHIVVVGRNDPLHQKLNNTHDINKYCPNLSEFTIKWFDFNKAASIGRNAYFSHKGTFQQKNLALKIIENSKRCYNQKIKNDKWEFTPLYDRFDFNKKTNDEIKININRNDSDYWQY